MKPKDEVKILLEALARIEATPGIKFPFADGRDGSQSDGQCQELARQALIAYQRRRLGVRVTGKESS